MQSDKKTLILRYQGKTIPKKLPVDQTINKLITLAKSLFCCADEDQYYLTLNGQEINEDILLGDPSIPNGAPLDLVQKVPTISDLVVFQILHGSDFLDCQGSLSRPLGEALDKFYKNNGLDPSSLEPFLDGKCVPKSILLQDIPNVEDVIISLVPKAMNQETRKGEEEKAEEKHIEFVLNENESYTLSVTWADKVSSLKPALSDLASIPKETFQMWSVGGKELDDNKPLSSQLNSDHLKIQVQLLKYANLTIDSKEKRLEKKIPIYPNYSIKELKIKFEQEIGISSSNQIWHLYGSKDGLSNDAKLGDYIQNPEDEPLTIFVKDQSERLKAQSKEKKLYTLKYQEKTLRKLFGIDEELIDIRKRMITALELSDDAPLVLKFKDKIMDLANRLSDYMPGPTETIRLELLQDPQDLTKVLLIYQDKDFELFVKKEATIQEIKEMACLELQIQPSYLYSLLLDDKILMSAAQLQQISEFGEDSVLELSSKVKVSLILDQKTLAEIVFDPSLKVEELKKQIQTKKLLKNQEEFYLKFGEMLIEESNPLSAYLKNEDRVAITICAKEKVEAKINLLFNKLPENKKYSFSALKSESFQDLTKKISQEFGVLNSNQVWRYKEEPIIMQSDWEDFVTRYNGKEELMIDVFECPRPFSRKVSFLKHQYGLVNSEISELDLNLLSSIAKLKQEVAQKLNLSESCSQAWKIESKELQDGLPLALYENSLKKECLHIYILDQRQVTLFVEGKALKVSLDLDTPIGLVKETLFREGKVVMSPEMQLWFFEDNDSQIFEDVKTLNFYIGKNHRNEICVKKRTFLLKILLNDIEANSKKNLDLECDPSLPVSILKEKVKSKLNIDSSQQYWTDGQKELKDECPLNSYLSEDSTAFIQVEVLKLKEFLIFDEKSRFILQAPLNMKVLDFKRKIQEHPQGLEVGRILLESYKKRLEDSKELQDYFNIWIQHERPAIEMKKKARLEIHFLERIENFYFDNEATVSILIEEIRERFSFGNHIFILWDEKKEVTEKDLIEILKNNCDKVLSCQKVKEVSMAFEDLLEDGKKIIKIDASKPLDLIAKKVSEKLKVPIDECIIIHKGKPCMINSDLLDYLDPVSPNIELTIQTIKIIEVQKQEQKFQINYLPSEAVGSVKKKLMVDGFSDIEKFSLIYNSALLKDDQTIESLGIKYGKHIFRTLPNRRISVIIKEEEYFETCGGSLKCVGDLKQKMKDSYQTDIGKQHLILINNEKWQRVLNQETEILEDIKSDSLEQINIVCKTIKKFSIRFGGQTKSETFEGLANACLEDQKKFFELIYRIPAEQQIWMTGRIGNQKLISEEEFLKNLGEDHYSTTSIQIFRKINLAICLNDKSHSLKDIPTYENVRAQKDKINNLLSVLPQNQSWFYDEKELEDDVILEEYFSMQKGANSPPVNYALDLIVLEDLEYFGFTEKNEINIDLFHNFSIESDEDLDLIIKSVSFNKKEESLKFRNRLLGLFFSTLKKHSLWGNLIHKIKKRTYDLKSINLWENNEKSSTQESQFNTQFLLYYFLNSGTSELNIEILRIMKLHFPVPLVINTWSNRFSIENVKVLDDLYWVMQKGYVVTSFGFGSANESCGKTELNNRLLHSNFVQSGERNDICKGCPEILFDIYKNDKFPINFIDIPNGTREDVKEKILASSNMLIVHSFEDEETTLNYLQKHFAKFPTIVLYRDYSNAFSNLTRFRETLAKSYQKALDTNLFEIKINKQPNYARSHELHDISEKIHEYLLHNFQRIENQEDLWKFSKFYESHNQSIHIAFDRIRNNSSQVVQAIPVFSDVKKIEKSNISSEKREAEISKVLNTFQKRSLSAEMNEILIILNTSETSTRRKLLEKPGLILEKLQEYLRMMKSQQTMDFYKLYEFKSKLGGCSNDDDKHIIEEFYKYWKDVGTKESFFKANKSEVKYTKKKEVLEYIERCVETFEQKIIPSIFSIELFWRELIYFNNLKLGHQVKVSTNPQMITGNDYNSSINLNDFLVSLKKENLLNSYPFEIIDGDLLYMPKEFYKTIFKGMNDRVIVISVLGPQSSGKSTLLNFLFGCNFVTSSGRCTKGVYGTYFKVSNFNSCDGILVLDTEGLFGLLNKSEEQQRIQFDKRLVLFCLAMSDFVFINFKGDIDRTLAETLVVCQHSLKKLQQGNVQIPEMFLILNQNTQTNINTQLQDIDKMSDLGFSQANVEVLPLAFETSTNESAAIRKFMDPVMKKIPKRDFSEKCRLLTQKLFDKISKSVDSKKQRTLETIIDRMEHLWESLDKYPDLLKHNRLQDQNQESEIKDWIEKEVDIKFTERMSKIVENIKMDSPIRPDWEERFFDKFSEESKAVKNEFNNLFHEGTQEYLFKDLESVLFAHIERTRIQKINEIKMQVQQEKMKIYDTQGNEIIRETAYKIKNMQDLSEEEKSKYFEESWQSVLSKLEKVFDQHTESKNLFNIVVENYKANINKCTGAIPKVEFPREIGTPLHEYQKELKKLIERSFISTKAFENTKQVPALIFKGGKTNVSFKYFDLRKYFEEITVEEFIGVRRNKVYEIFDFDKMSRDFFKYSKSEEKEKIAIKAIADKICEEFELCGITIPIWIVKKTMKFQSTFFTTRWTSPNYVKAEEFNKKNCQVDLKFTIRKESFTYIKKKEIQELLTAAEENRLTPKCFFESVIYNAVDWKNINGKLKSDLDAIYSQSKTNQLKEDLKQDLSKINLVLSDFEPILNTIWCNDIQWAKEKVGHFIQFESNALDKFATIDQSRDFLTPLNFHYIKKDVLRSHLQNFMSTTDNQSVVIKKFKGKKRVVKKEYGNITWLRQYSNDETSKIFSNTLENKPLLELVFQEFNFKGVVESAFENCLENVKKIKNWNSTQLYQTIVRETNDYIGAANNDLQQVSYRLDSQLVGNIHATMVLLIWKFFEEDHWKKITKPLVDIKDKKIQQKKFFDSIASSDLRKINDAEADKVKQDLRSYILSNMVSEEKKKLIENLSQKFRNEIKRKQLQEKIDARYFSRNATANNDDLYFYILNPRDILLKTYEDTSQSYLEGLQNELEQVNIDSNKILQELIQRITSTQILLSAFQEDVWNLDNMFEFQEYNSNEKGEVGMNAYSSHLGGIYYRILLNIMKGTPENISNEYKIDDHTKVTVKLMNELQIPSTVISEKALEILDFLELQPGKVTNAKLFMESLVEQVKTLIVESTKFFEFTEDDKKEFMDQINIFICKAQCPCCDRICGEEDPHHGVHQCLYGHQIRAIGGTMLDNKEASIVRCEDVEDFDQMYFNGQQMSWAEFKEKMRNQPNNPWSFDDILQTRKDESIKEKFNFAWTLIGERVCKETYKDLNMKYVAYNQATIQNQKVRATKPATFIYLIDSSGSMGGGKWDDLKASLRNTLGSIHSLNQNNKVTIINFSYSPIMDYQDTPPNKISVDVLRYQGGGTDFAAAFKAGLDQMKSITQNDIVLVFMTDGEDSYPQNEITQIKSYVQSSNFKNLGIKFDFSALGFQCSSNILVKMAGELGGTTKFAHDRTQLTKAFIEIILDKKIGN
jgi:hypothetical protein